MSTQSSSTSTQEGQSDRQDSKDPQGPRVDETGLLSASHPPDHGEGGTVNLANPVPADATSDGQRPNGDTGGRFRLLRPHAEGGLGRVSIALDSELGREVALEQIRDPFADDPVRRSKFLIEAVVTGRLEHPGIVPIYALDQDESERPYYAMRFIRGQTLQASIRRFHDAKAGASDHSHSALELRLLLEKFLVVCDALEFAHSRGVILRDLKPEMVQARMGRTRQALSTLSWMLEPKNHSSVPTSTTSPWLAIARAFRARCFSQTGQVAAAKADLQEVRRWFSTPEARKLSSEDRQKAWVQYQQAEAEVAPAPLPQDVFVP